MAGVVFEDVQKVYPDGTQAIFDLSLQIEDGEFVILVGPSGCGKSTALRMVAGLEEISGGKLYIGDQVVNDLSPKERDIAMVFQSYALYPHMSVADNMGFALKLAKTPKEEIDRRVNDAADILGLTEYLHRKPKALSGGQRQRVAMGRAIVRSPQAFLMDEPLSNLDAKLRVQMRAEIAALQNRLGVTTVYVTHDQIEAMTMGDRVAVLMRGKLQQADSPQTLYNEPKNLFVAGFIGSPSMNIAQATLVKADGRVWIELDRGQTRLLVPDAALDRYPGAAQRDGGPVAIGMRPEHFAPVDEVAPEQIWRDREVTLVEMLGAEMLVHFRTDTPPIVTDDMKEAIDDDEAFEELKRQAASGGQTFTARFEPGNPPKSGTRIDVGFRTERLHFFDPETGLALR
ncbi:putative sugar ABC transporter, ATP-binding protein SugC [Egicoccus halophilus]|uniref:Putative sugar ABC transporter, ATP-binding protein SugC n=2 Tax=Egicoccus halophilus TaxID=1670830 RepID=A0A8J3ADQ8_9ACTN|nr:sn-glycerol-3-phosphate ABC transporter ATP-binding protein UgpC [Egicoccus halophilus]GGI09867.1 putative sugar ABC transporter, ATP-binding protein SugC [Egicoccus halophilus]